VGPGEPVPDTSTCRGPTVFITAQSLVPLPPEKYRQGYRAALSSLRRNSQSPLSRMKLTSYVDSVLARREARLRGVDEVVMLNEKGMVAEGSVSNIFIVSKGVLVTPSLDCGALPGITRAVVLELARSMATPVAEREVTLEELANADEVFVTNSVIEVVPLTWFEERPIGQGRPGAVALRLLGMYQALVRQETGLDRP
ncbi:MAG: aminotransferase class IV, partial [Dehalococcoidia bacterium]|nr:aminotransferase class IV [Dehalococcoidia bacterium]